MHTVEIVRSPPRAAPVVRPMGQLDVVDRLILSIVNTTDEAVTPTCISERLFQDARLVVGACTVGHRLRVLHRERRLVYIDRRGDHTRYALPCPGMGYRKNDAGERLENADTPVIHRPTAITIEPSCPRQENAPGANTESVVVSSCPESRAVSLPGPQLLGGSYRESSSLAQHGRVNAKTPDAEERV